MSNILISTIAMLRKEKGMQLPSSIFDAMRSKALWFLCFIEIMKLIASEKMLEDIIENKLSSISSIGRSGTGYW